MFSTNIKAFDDLYLFFIYTKTFSRNKKAFDDLNLFFKLLEMQLQALFLTFFKLHPKMN